MGKQALILIDYQMDYFADGAMHLPLCDEALSNATKVLNQSRESGMPIIHIQHKNEHPEAPFLRADSDGCEIHPSLKPLDSEKLYVKNFPSSFQATSLLSDLKEQGITELIVMGMMTNMCVDSTVRTAFEYGFEVTLIEDSCAAQRVITESSDISAEDVHTSFVYWLAAIFCKVVKTDQWISSQL